MLHSIIQFHFISSSSLNNFQQMSYFTVCIPLYFVFIILICLSFGSKSNNWWFGIRKDFATFLLSTCPCLREYANISYNKQNQLSNNNSNNNNSLTTDNNRTQSENDLQQIDALKYKLKNQQPKNNLPCVPHLTLMSLD